MRSVDTCPYTPDNRFRRPRLERTAQTTYDHGQACIRSTLKQRSNTDDTESYSKWVGTQSRSVLLLHNSDKSGPLDRDEHRRPPIRSRNLSPNDRHNSIGHCQIYHTNTSPYHDTSWRLKRHCIPHSQLCTCALQSPFDTRHRPETPKTHFDYPNRNYNSDTTTCYWVEFRMFCHTFAQTLNPVSFQRHRFAYRPMKSTDWTQLPRHC